MRRRGPMRRGPSLLGVAVVGGAAYHAGKSGANAKANEQAQNQQLADLQAQNDQLAAQQQAMAQQPPPQPVYQQPPPPQYQPAPAAPGAMTDEKINQLKQLGDLKAAGILTDEEFAAQKAKVLAS